MNKVSLSLTAVVVSVSLLAGCSANGTNNVRSQSTNYRHHNMVNQNRGLVRPLDAATTPGNTTTTPSDTAQHKFSDVPSGEWYAESVQWSSNLGIIDGYPDGTFQPDKSMTRAEVIKVIKSLADKGYIVIPSGTTPGGTTTTPGGTTTTPGGTTTTPGGTTTTP
ncbi:hypothetical protein GNP93_13195 [Paenibacillus validus]|uniref:SLH domain-containing protein n=3 Tax=Paenibacillus TaxID=44249 RepID=A0A7X2ZCL1_9BACL|nr:hypothetical protein [Paenibacillus validus]